MVEPWFDPITFGSWFGAIAGGVGGTLCGCLGALTGVLAPKGRGRRVILGSMYLVVGIGLVLVLFGAVALVNGQPYAIWYGPIIAGTIFAIINGVLIPVVKRRYREAEERRVDAQSLRSM